MNLLENIHDRWTDDTVLNGLLPATRVKTGTTSDVTLPFAVWTRDSQAPVLISNDGAASDNVGLRCQVFHENYDDGYEIAERVKAVFHNVAIQLQGFGGSSSSSGETCKGDIVVSMRRTNDYELQDPDGVWRFVVDFLAKVYLPEGT